MNIAHKQKAVRPMVQVGVTATAVLALLVLVNRVMRHSQTTSNIQSDRIRLSHPLPSVEKTATPSGRRQIEILNQRLLLAADAGDEAAVRSLVDQRADLHSIANDALNLVCDKNMEGHGNRPLTLIQFIIDHGAKVNDADVFGKTPLIIAASAGNADTVKLLIQSGANVNSADGSGSTPLMAAACDKYIDAERLLLEHGARVNVKDTQGNTPLMSACYSSRGDETACNPVTVHLLLEHGANVNDTDDVGETALIHLALSGQDDKQREANDTKAARVARDLVEHGANPMASGNGGETALSWARDHKMKRLTEYLLTVVPVPDPAASNSSADGARP